MNDEATITRPRRATLEVPGAHLFYEFRGQGPLVALVGAPMDADAFAPLAARLRQLRWANSAPSTSAVVAS